jgi:hypothetical protein
LFATSTDDGPEESKSRMKIKIMKRIKSKRKIKSKIRTAGISPALVVCQAGKLTVSLADPAGVVLEIAGGAGSRLAIKNTRLVQRRNLQNDREPAPLSADLCG